LKINYKINILDNEAEINNKDIIDEMYAKAVGRYMNSKNLSRVQKTELINSLIKALKSRN